MCGYMDQSWGVYEFLRSQPLTDGTVGAPKVDATTKTDKGSGFFVKSFEIITTNICV